MDRAALAERDENPVTGRPKQWWGDVREFFRDTAAEMKKVSWPSKNEVIGTTVVVIVATIVFAVYLWGCDLVFYKAIDFLFTRFGART
jgi:preprotein translocase subunit SecE